MIGSVVVVVVVELAVVVVDGVVVVVVVDVVVVLMRSTRGGMVGLRLNGRLLPPLGLRAVLIRDGPRKPGTLGLYCRPGSAGGGGVRS